MAASSQPASSLGELHRPAEQLIDDSRNGRMFILIDDDMATAGGHLVIPAQMATPDAINFMAIHGRGLICLALGRARVEQLGLGLMSQQAGARPDRAFTVSIEAREGVTTGISAADRARTVAVAIDAGKNRSEIVTPGHVFPLVARDGGVLVRAGHTEAAVDIARLAGLNPSAVICEILQADGAVAGRDSLVALAQAHGLKIGTISDLIAYRRQHDHLVERLTDGPFTSDYGGDWRIIAYGNKVAGGETMALVKGHVDPAQPTLVRMHNLNVFSDTLGESGTRSGLLARAMHMIGEEGRGVVVLINRYVPDALSRALRQRAGAQAADADGDLRDYGIGAQILAELGVHDMILLTNSHHAPVALDGYGLSIVDERPIQ